MCDMSKKGVVYSCLYTRACIWLYFNPGEEDTFDPKKELKEEEIKILEKYYRKPYEECREPEENYGKITVEDLIDFYQDNREKRHAALSKCDIKDKNKVLLFCKILIADLMEEVENEEE
jgi:hypothetical protein